MSNEKTLSIIKPDAVQRGIIGEIYGRFEKAGLQIVAAKMMHLTLEDAESFYAVHKGKPFYIDLINFISSGPIVVQVLYGENAIQKNREIMGATNPLNADVGSIRRDYGNMQGIVHYNVVHGSDCIENAIKEIEFFFSKEEIFLEKI
ncbi:MAG: nucleoside-diphosphate kinase [Pseudomonadota bacterium]